MLIIDFLLKLGFPLGQYLILSSLTRMGDELERLTDSAHQQNS